jgi:hypothetical protein
LIATALALKQACTKFAFQTCYATANRREAYAQRQRRTGEATRARHGEEVLEIVPFHAGVQKRKYKLQSLL